MPKIGENKMRELIGFRTRVVLVDSRTFVGTLKAFDGLMNLILADCIELRKVESENDGEQVEKRALGLVLFHGQNIVSMTADEPPPAEPFSPIALRTDKRPNFSRAALRGYSQSRAASTARQRGPVQGLEGPSAQMILPRHRPGRRGVAHAGCHGLRGMRGMRMRLRIRGAQDPRATSNHG